MGKLDGKAAVITGAASGIGRASALLFAREGAAVLVADVDRRRGEQVAREIGAESGRAVFVEVDVARAPSVRAMIERALSEFGRLDILFNNAGIGGDLGPLAESTEENFDRVIAVNLKGVFLGMKFGIEAMLRSGGGAIINTASVAGLIGARGFSAYGASKGGVIQLTRAAALEYADRNIRVNCICPGIIDTPILGMIPDEMRARIARRNPMGRMGTAEEIARAALFLASDDSSYATGAVLVLDGGASVR